MISIRDIVKTYQKKRVIALNHINLTIQKGEIFGLIGPDGAGKSSLFRLMTTLLLPDNGTITIDGLDVVTDYKKIRQTIGYLPGKFSLYTDLTVEENLTFFATIFGTTVQENYHLIKDIYQQIEPFKDRLAGKLSGGMKQKLALSCALIHAPKVIFLDEPTTGIDPVSRKELWQMLRNLKEKYQITIVVSTPYRDEVFQCDRIALMDKGEVKQIGTPNELMTEEEVLNHSDNGTTLYQRPKIIETHQLTKTFNKFTAVDHITFDVHEGEIFGFLGANGAGKTTAMRILCGLSQPSDGSAKVAGYDVATQHEEVKRHIGYMSQKFSLYDELTIEENLRFFGGIYGLSDDTIKMKTDQMLAELNMEDERNKVVESLPLGWKQKLAFSLSILHDPKIVFLDEPTGGVDAETRKQFWKMIYRAADRGITIFVTTHYMDEAEYCDRVSIMVDGKIEALDSPSNLKKLYHVDTMYDVFLYLARYAKRGY